MVPWNIMNNLDIAHWMIIRIEVTWDIELSFWMSSTGVAWSCNILVIKIFDILVEHNLALQEPNSS